MEILNKLKDIKIAFISDDTKKALGVMDEQFILPTLARVIDSKIQYKTDNQMYLEYINPDTFDFEKGKNSYQMLFIDKKFADKKEILTLLDNNYPDCKIRFFD